MAVSSKRAVFSSSHMAVAGGLGYGRIGGTMSRRNPHGSFSYYISSPSPASSSVCCTPQHLPQRHRISHIPLSSSASASSTSSVPVLVSNRRYCASSSSTSPSPVVAPPAPPALPYHPYAAPAEAEDEYVNCTLMRKVDPHGFVTRLGYPQPVTYRPCAVMDHVYNLVMRNQAERLQLLFPSTSSSSSDSSTTSISNSSGDDTAAATPLLPPAPNILVTGPEGTGKLSLLLRLADDLKVNYSIKQSQQQQEQSFTEEELELSSEESESSSNNNKRKLKSELTVCVTTMNPRLANIIDGLTTYIFLGVKKGTEPTSYEQAFNALDRHILLMEEFLGKSFCTIANTDVLVIDSLHLMPHYTLRAFDAVARKHRKNPHEPFGGIQVLATANFWKMPGVHPTSPLDDYVFQSEIFNELFPLRGVQHQSVSRNNLRLEQSKNRSDDGDDVSSKEMEPEPFHDNGTRQFLLQRVWKHEQFGLNGAKYNLFAIKALYGRLNDTDAASFEALCQLDASATEDTPPVTLTDNLAGRMAYMPRFAKYFSEFELPPKMSALRKTDFGNYMQSILNTIGNEPGWGFSPKLDFVAGETIVALTHDMYDDDGETVDIPAGTTGRAINAREHSITVQFEGKRVRDINRLCLSLYHPDHPMLKSRCLQFPLLQVNKIYPLKLLDAPCTPLNLKIDAYYVTETNELANLMIKMRGPVGVSFQNIKTYMKREGMTHEPAKYYYEELMRFQAGETAYGKRAIPPAVVATQQQHHSQVAASVKQSGKKGSSKSKSMTQHQNTMSMSNSIVSSPYATTPAPAPRSGGSHNKQNKKKTAVLSTTGNKPNLQHEIDNADANIDALLSTDAVYKALYPENDRERWCRNCKNHFYIDDFFEHWKECIEKQRWCPDCSVTVPASKWEAHLEKHTVIMCIDCARSLEWRHWEQHRLTCGAMLREVSADNEMLPDTTKKEVLQGGHDRRDLHTVKKVTKGALPKGNDFQGDSKKLKQRRRRSAAMYS